MPLTKTVPTQVTYLTELEALFAQAGKYHNKCHAADVAKSTFYLIMKSEVKNYIDDQENIVILVPCLGHDIGHPGLNNRFLVNNSENLAVIYIDVSVLENMHASATF